MPGRLSNRSNVPSRTSKSYSTETADIIHLFTSLRMGASEEGAPSQLRQIISNLFSDAQKAVAGHRKLVVGLRKIQEACVYETPAGNKSKPLRDDFDEEDFNFEFSRCVLRLMSIRRAETVGDRLVKFVATFLKCASDKDAALIPEDDCDEAQYQETPASRLVTQLLALLLQFTSSKEKTVRYRATQLVAQIINCLDSIDDEHYLLLETALLKRLKDRESMVRVQAVLGLGRLAGQDGGSEEITSNGLSTAEGLTPKLLHSLRNDPSADVRRALLLNLPLTPETLPCLLERARDTDGATRRVLYSRLLPNLGDFRHLSLSMREKLLRWGLRDRDESVRKAAARLFSERWIQDCAKASPQQGSQSSLETASPDIDGLLELLERIDVVNSGTESGVASEAMGEFWKARPDYVNEIIFGDAFWQNLNPESVYLVRTLNDFDKDKTNNTVQEKMPELTKLAFYLMQHAHDLLKHLADNGIQAENSAEEDTIEKEFVVEQLLHMTKTADYSDEVGRRAMFHHLRDLLASPLLPDEITKLTIEILRNICGNEPTGEREFCGVILEAMAEVHDVIAPEIPHLDHEGDESFHSARSELSDSTSTQQFQSQGAGSGAIEQLNETKAVQEIMINMKCLHIAQCMLQNVEGVLQSNVQLVTMLNNLVVPAVRSHEAPIRERGLICLGLCCLLDKKLAEENLTLFVHCFHKGQDALQLTAVQVLADILGTHPSLMQSQDADVEVRGMIVKIFASGIKASQAPEVRSAATTAVCKLMLTSVIQDEDLLTQIVNLYFDPETKENAGVMQTLSYSLPVYCHSKRENMELMANIAVGVMHAAVELSQDLEGAEMVGIGVVGSLLTDWTDARKLVIQDEIAMDWDAVGRRQSQAVNGDIQLRLAERVLERVLHHGCPKEERKAQMSMLGKLWVNGNSRLDKLESVNKLVIEAIDGNIAGDAASRTSINKLYIALGKALGEARKQTTDSAETEPRRDAEEMGMTDAGQSSDAASTVNGTVKKEDVAYDTMPAETQDPVLEYKLPDGEGDSLDSII